MYLALGQRDGLIALSGSTALLNRAPFSNKLADARALAGRTSELTDPHLSAGR